jgi:hypothetical protein
MPRRDEEEDYDDLPGRRRNASLPAGVRAAGIIWLTIGILGLTVSVLSLVVNVATVGAGGGGPGGGGGAGPAPICCSFGCSVIVPAVFLMVGIQTFKGTAKGTLGNGIGSIVFGLLALAAPVVILLLIGRVAAAGGGPPGGVAAAVLYIFAAVYGLIGLALLTAGFLAIAGRDAYTEWRVARGLARGPKRTAEQEDYEDRPRRRRRDEDDDDR